MELIPGLGIFPGEGNGNPLQYSCLENSMDRGAWWAIVHGVAKSWTRLSTHAGDSDASEFCQHRHGETLAVMTPFYKHCDLICLFNFTRNVAFQILIFPKLELRQTMYVCI